MAYTIFQRILIATFKIVNLLIPWHKLPKYIGALNLLALRDELREENLYDVYPSEDFQGTTKSTPMPETKYLCARNSDGLFNDLKSPRMGCVGMRFGRNVPRKYTAAPDFETLMTPNPRLISDNLLARTDFKPATIVNMLAAAWIQFQVHDWAQHFNSTTENWSVPPAPTGRPQRTMLIPKTVVDEPLDEEDQKYPAYRDENTHWWDASQIYGSTEEDTRRLRSLNNDGTLTVDRINGEQFLPRGSDNIPLTGFNNNWWIGLELMHTLFALEHNSICAKLKTTYPAWTGDEIFDTARLINCALMAKIHTVEWTPAILAHPTLEVSMNANWSGLVGERLQGLLGHFSKDEAITGIPLSGADSGVAPYCLTEEFVSVYRLHPLIPDTIAFFDIKDGSHRGSIPMVDLAFDKARTPFDSASSGGLDLTFGDAFYSFGVNYPGAITVHNTPEFIRNLHKPDGEHLDMGVVDILRDRERSVPRYCQFRRLFHMPAPKTFKQLTGGNVELAEELASIYNDDIETVDLLVGCLSEPLPAGFGFSDTAFRVFILMASRRLKSDRFIATDFKDEVYTREGIEWVQQNTMKDVLMRQFPELRASLRDVKNAFAPWEKVGKTAEYMGVATNAPSTK